MHTNVGFYHWDAIGADVQATREWLGGKSFIERMGSMLNLWFAVWPVGGILFSCALYSNIVSNWFLSSSFLVFFDMQPILLTIQWPWTKYGCCPSIDLEGSSYWQITFLAFSVLYDIVFQYFSHVSLCVVYAFALSFILSSHSIKCHFRLLTPLLISRSLCDLLAAGFARVDVEDTASSIKPSGRSTWFFFKNGACRLLLQKRIQVALLPGLSVSSLRTSHQIIQHHVKSWLVTTRPTRMIPYDTMILNPFLVPISGPPESSAAS